MDRRSRVQSWLQSIPHIASTRNILPSWASAVTAAQLLVSLYLASSRRKQRNETFMGWGGGGLIYVLQQEFKYLYRMFLQLSSTYRKLRLLSDIRVSLMKPFSP